MKIFVIKRFNTQDFFTLPTLISFVTCGPSKSVALQFIFFRALPQRYCIFQSAFTPLFVISSFSISCLVFTVCFSSIQSVATVWFPHECWHFSWTPPNPASLFFSTIRILHLFSVWLNQLRHKLREVQKKKIKFKLYSSDFESNHHTWATLRCTFLTESYNTSVVIFV